MDLVNVEVLFGISGKVFVHLFLFQTDRVKIIFLDNLIEFIYKCNLDRIY